jgi:hypothetical protein
MANPNKKSLACTVALIFGLMLSCAQLILVVRWGEEKVAAELQYISRIEGELSSMNENVSTGKLSGTEGESTTLDNTPILVDSRDEKGTESQGSEHYAGMKHILKEWMADQGSTGYDTRKGMKLYHQTVTENSCGEEDHDGGDSPIWPLSGPEFGGTTVTIKLDAGSVVSDSGAVCYFGEKQVPAVRVSQKLGGDAREFSCFCFVCVCVYICMCVCAYVDTCMLSMYA